MDLAALAFLPNELRGNIYRYIDDPDVLVQLYNKDPHGVIAGAESDIDVVDDVAIPVDGVGPVTHLWVRTRVRLQLNDHVDRSSDEEIDPVTSTKGLIYDGFIDHGVRSPPIPEDIGV